MRKAIKIIERYGRDKLIKRLLNISMPEPNTGCWLWLGACGKAGYGQASVNSYQFSAHRLSYECFIGEIPINLTIDHLCKQTCCINPQHLEPVTLYVNIMRGNTRARINKEKTHCNKGHEFNEQNTYKNKRGRACRVCEKERLKIRDARDDVKKKRMDTYWGNQEAVNKRVRERYLKDETMKDKRKIRYFKNREKILARMKLNKDAINARRREVMPKYRAENKDKINKRAREWYARIKSKISNAT